MKICERCMRAIKPGEEHHSHTKLSMSGAGSTFHYHLACSTPRSRPRAPRRQSRG
jgi:hypothetical protein